MSSIGPSSISGMNLAGTFAAAQRTDKDADRKVNESAEQKRVHDQADVSESSLEDVSESTSSGDRDADGRLPYGLVQPELPTEEQDEESPPPKPKAINPDDDRGTLLDLEA
ncbi:MAG: hypothetical protein O3A29_14030 [Planctomycetota bacterium]|nr:hypothetical protein [Planctomycetota bacterium]